jgi:phosphatidylserine/phosphatidylglycerophosphate/cardiolipin synthase-like enzyme
MTARTWWRLGASLLLVALLLWSVREPVGVQAGAIEVFYGPEDQPTDKLVEIYEQARRYIYIAVYGLTYPSLVKALVEAKKRGVDVRVITDRERMQDPKQRTAIETLRLAGIPVRVNQHDGLMHVKQTVVDDRINTSGSANYTGSANRYNDERLDVLTDPVTSAKAREKFLAMWKDEERFRSWK